MDQHRVDLHNYRRIRPARPAERRTAVDPVARRRGGDWGSVRLHNTPLWPGEHQIPALSCGDAGPPRGRRGTDAAGTNTARSDHRGVGPRRAVMERTDVGREP